MTEQVWSKMAGGECAVTGRGQDRFNVAHRRLQLSAMLLWSGRIHQLLHNSSLREIHPGRAHTADSSLRSLSVHFNIPHEDESDIYRS